MIRPVTLADLESLSKIYNHYITNTSITFDTEEMTTIAVGEKMISNAKYPCLVYAGADEIAGFVTASEWKAKKAYQHTAEISIYLHPDQCGKGYGKLLLQELLQQLRLQDVRSVISGIIMPNDRSVSLHENLLFKNVANFSEVGKKFGKWLDVSYWQLML